MSQRFLNPLELNFKRYLGKVMVIKSSLNYNLIKYFHIKGMESRSPDSLVGVTVRLRSRNRGDFSLLHSLHTDSGAHLSSSLAPGTFSLYLYFNPPYVITAISRVNFLHTCNTAVSSPKRA